MERLFCRKISAFYMTQRATSRRSVFLPALNMDVIYVIYSAFYVKSLAKTRFLRKSSAKPFACMDYEVRALSKGSLV